MSNNPPVLFPDPTWQACYVSFLQHAYDKSQSALSRYRYQLLVTQFFTAVGKPPERVLRSDVERFLVRPCQSARNRGGPPSPSTRNSRLCALSAFYKFASNYLVESPENVLTPLFQGHRPTAGIVYLKVPRTARALSEREIDALFAAIPADTVLGLRDRAIFLMYFYTGRRRAEIARLRYGDLAYGPIPNGDGTSHTGWTYRFTGKGKGGEIDTAELPQPAYDALHRYWCASDRLATLTADSPLFSVVGATQGGGRRAKQPDSPLHMSTIRHALKKYARAAGLDPATISIHKWRHSAAQQRYKAGQDIFAISHLLRHSNVGITHIYLQGLCGTADPGASLIAAKFAHL